MRNGIEKFGYEFRIAKLATNNLPPVPYIHLSANGQAKEEKDEDPPQGTKQLCSYLDQCAKVLCH